MKNNGGVVGRINVIDMLVSGGLGTGQYVVQHGINGVFDVTRGQQASVMKVHARSQVEDISQPIGDLIALGQHGLQVKVLVAAKERVKDQHVNALGLRVNAGTRIEVCRAALDDHHQGARVGTSRTSGEQ